MIFVTKNDKLINRCCFLCQMLLLLQNLVLPEFFERMYIA